ncbi:hypothetical protein HPB49_004340 [Dermacentor silvarum]|uniref:Uncharacterized protein n=1 Tax=Dermacentor silvarum TaxID=543639 RepID=A0ACB8CQ09_DERSI|nr:hypothetical protein HPB49_004340 [Dermacentor silvarum]
MSLTDLVTVAQRLGLHGEDLDKWVQDRWSIMCEQAEKEREKRLAERAVEKACLEQQLRKPEMSLTDLVTVAQRLGLHGEDLDKWVQDRWFIMCEQAEKEREKRLAERAVEKACLEQQLRKPEMSLTDLVTVAQRLGLHGEDLDKWVQDRWSIMCEQAEKEREKRLAERAVEKACLEQQLRKPEMSLTDLVTAAQRLGLHGEDFDKWVQDRWSIMCEQAEKEREKRLAERAVEKACLEQQLRKPEMSLTDLVTVAQRLGLHGEDLDKWVQDQWSIMCEQAEKEREKRLAERAVEKACLEQQLRKPEMSLTDLVTAAQRLGLHGEDLDKWVQDRWSIMCEQAEKEREKRLAERAVEKACLEQQLRKPEMSLTDLVTVAQRLGLHGEDLDKWVQDRWSIMCEQAEKEREKRLAERAVEKACLEQQLRKVWIK